MIETTWASTIASILTIFAYVPYVVSMVKGTTRPHLITWSIWSVLGAILTASYWAAGAPLDALLVPLLNVLGPIIISLFAIKYGQYGYHYFDIICLGIALLGLTGWAVTGNPLIALSICLIVDFSGALPTIKKVAADPASENMTAWLLFLVANSLNLFTIPDYTVELVSYPLYLFLIPLIIIAFQLKPSRTQQPIDS